MQHPVDLDVCFVIRPPASTALDKPRGLWDLVDVITENNLIRAIVIMDVTYAFPIRGNRRANGSSARSIGKLGSSRLHSPGLGLSMPADSSCRRQGPSHQPSNRCRVRL